MLRSCAADGRTRSRAGSASAPTRSCTSPRLASPPDGQLTHRLLYDGHVVKDGDSLAGLCALGVDEDELRAGVHFEMNARRESSHARAPALMPEVGGALGRGRDRGRGGLCASCLCAAGR